MLTEVMYGGKSTTYGYIYEGNYFQVYDGSGSNPSAGTKTYTATKDCIVEVSLTLSNNSTTWAGYAYISLNSTQVRSLTNASGAGITNYYKEIFRLKANDTLTVEMRSYRTGADVNVAYIYTIPE